MKSALTTDYKANPVELAILAKWMLQETWFYCLEVLQQRLKQKQITNSEKENLEEMYAAFFHQAFYSPVRTITDINNLLKNLRKMLSLLKHLDNHAWDRFMVEYDLKC